MSESTNTGTILKKDTLIVLCGREWIEGKHTVKDIPLDF